MTGLRRAAPAALMLLACAGCSYLGSATSFDPEALDRDPGWKAVRGVPVLLQKQDEDCGAAALAMVLAYWRVDADEDAVLKACPAVKGEGIKAKELRDFARTSGLEAYLIHGRWEDFAMELPRGRPVLVGLVKPYATGGFSHYEVVVALHPEERVIVTLDPANGWRQNTLEGFEREWAPSGHLAIVFARAPSPAAEQK